MATLKTLRPLLPVPKVTAPTIGGNRKGRSGRPTLTPKLAPPGKTGPPGRG